MTNLAKPRIIALLPMKANSVRVKGKNFRHFCGKPLFRWVLDTLLQVKEIERVIINTDARKILESHGLVEDGRVSIRERDPIICGDHVSMNKIIADDINHLAADIYVMTHTTNPLISADTIRAAIGSYRTAINASTADSLFTVNRFQTRFYSASGTPINHNPADLVPTQELEPWFEENSNLYLFSADSFSLTQSRIGERPLLFESPRLESIDIDTEDDWAFAVQAAQFMLNSCLPN